MSAATAATLLGILALALAIGAICSNVFMRRSHGGEIITGALAGLSFVAAFTGAVCFIGVIT